MINEKIHKINGIFFKKIEKCLPKTPSSSRNQILFDRDRTDVREPRFRNFLTWWYEWMIIKRVSFDTINTLIMEMDTADEGK